ncbi:MAG: hypothetical protein IKN43_11785 [Selenomonadaceae bacterium]|nr:hypothetical protein [Selenomonadaceae bacterium]
MVSSGGSIFRYALELLKSCGSKVKFIMISDRECKAEKIAEEYGLPLHKIYNKSKTEFSVECKKCLDRYEKIDAVMTFVWRLVTKELIDAYPCVNIHPALLPAFKGFGAVKQAYDSNVKFFGSTLHMVDEEMDHGPVIAQVQTPKRMGITLKEMTESAFVQDVYLMLLFIDFMERGVIKIGSHYDVNLVAEITMDDRCNPLIGNKRYAEKVRQLQEIRGIRVIY